MDFQACGPWSKPVVSGVLKIRFSSQASCLGVDVDVYNYTCLVFVVMTSPGTHVNNVQMM